MGTMEKKTGSCYITIWYILVYIILGSIRIVEKKIETAIISSKQTSQPSIFDEKQSPA